MQVNCDDLLQCQSRLQAEKCGCLQVALCKSSSSSRSDSSSSGAASYCRLAGNLLFISRGIDPVAQDFDYLVVLEALKLDIDYSPTTAEPARGGGYAFRLVFDQDSSHTVLLRATSEAERSAWVAAIREASLLDKLDAAEAARQKIASLTGRDPLAPPPVSAEPLDAVDKDVDVGGGGAACTVTVGGLELDLSCRDLPPLMTSSTAAGATPQFPNALVEVQVRTPPLQEDWSFVGRTDAVDNCAEPMFRKLVVVPEGQHSEESSWLRFDLFDVRDQASATMRCLFTAEASLRQLATQPELPLLPAAASAAKSGAACSDGDAPTLIVRTRRRSDRLGPSQNRHGVLLRHLCTEQRLVASRAYKFARESCGKSGDESSDAETNQLIVKEFLCDLKCGMHLPLQVANLELARLRTLEAALAALGEHNCPRQQPELRPLYRLSQPEKLLPQQVSALCQEFAACVEGTNRSLFNGEFLKLSRLRHSQPLAFVPPNLQLHRLAVVDAREKPLDYLDIVSMGAPVAHYRKFKKGGLQAAFKATPGLEDALDVCEQASRLLHEGSQLCEKIIRLLTSSQQRAAQQQQMMTPLSGAPSAPSTEMPKLSDVADAERLAELVNSLIFLASNYLIVQTRIALEMDSVGMQQLHRLLLSATAAETATGAEPPQVAAACDQLLQEVNSVWLQCRLTLARLWLSEAVKVSPPDALLSAYRRRATSFSQMLTAVSCGIAAHFTRWSEATWRQMEACGIPVFMESLLSAYKNECGMLEDMAATVPRIATVTVAFFPGALGDQPIVDESLRRVRVSVPQQLWDRLSASLDSLLRCHSFRLVPLLFSVGINEQQTLAETKRVASLAVQRDLNKRSAAALKALVDQVIRYRRSNQQPPVAAAAGAASSSSSFAQFDGSLEDTGQRSVEQLLRDKMQQVELLCVQEDSSKGKPVALLHTAEEMLWLLDGVRLTNCKSGKDRTAMAVTLEQARWLRERHRLRADRASFDSTVAFLRTHGLRRRNCFRNVGSNLYAFNRVQLHAFPQAYRPPRGTYQRGPT